MVEPRRTGTSEPRCASGNRVAATCAGVFHPPPSPVDPVVQSNLATIRWQPLFQLDAFTKARIAARIAGSRVDQTTVTRIRSGSDDSSASRTPVGGMVGGYSFRVEMSAATAGFITRRTAVQRGLLTPPSGLRTVQLAFGSLHFENSSRPDESPGGVVFGARARRGGWLGCHQLTPRGAAACRDRRTRRRLVPRASIHQ